MLQTTLFDQPPEQSTVVLTAGSVVDAARRVMADAGEGHARFQVVTRTPLAARALGVRHRSLTDVARASLASRGLRFANGVTRRAALRDAIADQWASHDAEGIARAVERTLDELLRAGAGVSGGAVSEGEAHPRLDRLMRLVAAYKERLARSGLVDAAEALWLVATDADRGHAPRLLVAGHAFVSAGEAAFLGVGVGRGSTLVLPTAAGGDAEAAVARSAFALNDETAAYLEGHGWRIARDAGRGERRPTRTEGFRLASLDAEVRYVLTAVKRLLGSGTAPDDVLLLAPDPRAYWPHVAEVASEYGIPVISGHSEPLSATPFGTLTASLLRVVAGGLPYEDTARLLSNRLVHPLSSEAWTEARRRPPHGVVRWERFDERARLLDWPRRASRLDYLERLRATLDGLGVEERLAGDPRSERHRTVLFATYEPSEVAAPVTLGEFVGELLEHLQLVSVRAGPPTGVGTVDTGGSSRSGAVAVVAASAAPGAEVRHAFVLGAAEGAMPRRLDPGAWLDYAERDAARRGGLAVVDALQAARREALQFDGIVRAATESLTLTYAEAGGRGESLPSPYFAALGIDGHAPPPGPKPPASMEELRRALVAAGGVGGDAIVTRAQAALAVELRRESGAQPDEFDGVIGIPYPRAGARFSATSLLALGQCPFKWFAGYALRLYEPEEADTELSPLTRGNLYHRALEEAFTTAARGGAVTRESVLAALPDAFAVAERDEAIHTANWELHRGQHLAALQRVVRSESFLPDGSEVLDSERVFGRAAGTPATWRGFTVSGRIDRIDRREGRLLLVDYKTSSSRPLGAKDESGQATVDLQLPIYLEAAVPALGLAGGRVAAEYYSLTKARVIAGVSDAGPDAYDHAALQGVADRAAAALDAGRYPVEPDRRYKACAYCAFDAVCRVGPRVERKRSGDA